jgi:hypothetical protein
MAHSLCLELLRSDRVSAPDAVPALGADSETGRASPVLSPPRGRPIAVQRASQDCQAGAIALC